MFWVHQGVSLALLSEEHPTLGGAHHECLIVEAVPVFERNRLSSRSPLHAHFPTGSQCVTA